MSSFISSSGLTYLWNKIKAWVNGQGFLTQHQDISGKADKATTLAGYGITNAYTKTESDGKYYALYGGTNLSPSSSNAVDLDNLTTPGSYYCASDASSQYVSNKPSSVNNAFRIWVSAPTGTDSTYRRQRFQYYDYVAAYERVSTNSGSSWSDWYTIQANLANYALASSLGNYLPLSGGTLTGALTVNDSIAATSATFSGNVVLPNGYVLYCKDTNGTSRNVFGISASNNLGIGYAMPGVGDVNIYATNFRIRVNGTALANQAMLITSDRKIGIGTTTPEELVHVVGNVKITGNLILGSTTVAVVYSGSTAPSSSTGSDGDIYIQTS